MKIDLATHTISPVPTDDELVALSSVIEELLLNRKPQCTFVGDVVWRFGGRLWTQANKSNLGN